MQTIIHRIPIKMQLIRLGWTQTDLAEAMGFSVEHVSRVMNGRKEMSERFRERLTEVLGEGIWENGNGKEDER